MALADLDNIVADTLTLSVDTVLNLTDGSTNFLTNSANTLIIGLDAGDTVNLIDSENWTTSSAALDVNGNAANESYTVYNHNTETAVLYIEDVA